ncbi:hypothetical protein D3C78_1292070 [compost metagenome]
MFCALLTISHIPTATVQFGFERRINLAKIKSTHGPTNCKRARYVRIGLDNGSIIDVNILKLLAPSIRAASSSDRGIVSKKPLVMSVNPIGAPAAYTRIKARCVSSNCSSLSNRNIAIILINPGNIPSTSNMDKKF